jgi:HK97 family phage portal protein
MGWLDALGMGPPKAIESRGAPAIEEGRSATVTQSREDFFAALGVNWNVSATEIVVNRDTALGVPAVLAAVQFLSGTLAGLPLGLYKKTREGRERQPGVLADLLHYAVNPQLSSFDWRNQFFASVFTEGRGLTWIERTATGQVVALWPMEAAKTTIKRVNGRKVYEYREDNGGPVRTYQAEEVIDVPFHLMPNGLTSRSPLTLGKDAIGLSIAVTQYGSQFLANGGVPPFAVTGNFQTSQALKRAGDDLAQAVKKAAKDKRQALVMPAGLEITPIGADPEKSQMVETQRFCIEQIARLFNLPPIFLQDLTHGTYNNAEQQDLHLVKHTLKRWVEQFEQELNLKLFGYRSNRVYAEFNMDGLLRGDFKTRMEGYARGVQTGILQPAEARERENLPFVEGSNKLFMQGATVPIESAGAVEAPPVTGDENGN